MTVNVNDVIEVSARAEFGGTEDVINVYQFRSDGPAAVPDAQAIIDIGQYLETLYTPLLGAQATTYIYRDLTFRNVTQSLLMGVTTWPTLTAGASAANSVPPGVAAVLNLVTDVARVVLRKYLGGFVDTTIDPDGTFSNAMLVLFLAFANALLIGFTSGGRTYSYGYLSPKTLSFVVPTTGTVTDIPGYQRRRKQGRGT